MATLNNSGKVAYVYDEGTDTWYAIGGNINTGSNYEWTGTHNFLNNVVFEDINSVVQAKAGVNNFLNPAARDGALTSPVRGTVCFIRQNSDAVAINQIQYYDGTRWVPHGGTVTLNAQTASSNTSYDISLNDIGKTITFDSTFTYTINIPANSEVAFPIGSEIDVFRMNTGSVTFSPNSGVTINSKNSNKSIAARYTGASIFKIDTNTWLLVGDLIA